MNPTTFRARVSNGTPSGQRVDVRGLTAVNCSEAMALTTTIVRGESLISDGYTVSATHQPDVYTVTGQPTVKKRTGEVVEHGPYTVDVVGQTCTCPCFAARGACKHLTGLTVGNGATATAPLTRGLVGLGEVGGARVAVRHIEGRPLVLCFRRMIDARVERAGLQLFQGAAAELTEPIALDLDRLMGDGRYAGLLLVTGAQEVPIWFGSAPQVIWGVQ